MSGCTDRSTLDKERKQHDRQFCDVTASQARTRKRVELEFTEMLSQKRAVANADSRQRSQSDAATESQDNITINDDEQRLMNNA